jgi:hypothetical protein
LTPQRFIELYARACMRILAVRLAHTTLRRNSAIVPHIEDAMFDGLTLRQIEVRMIYGLL